ncbi:septation regulator SpoVG [Heliobacterium undosum]|uniref:Putative septation protein SpoVG n=1 Tax=Heliomicrobium undosum TaxID=121734 RepID=A0A845L1T1_9FIRM|nr:septation regulator SpoVG [Heliomicrobium undosum]MZP28764.1 septation regulator SpoVG [Heliomicrobium undosum]
MNITDVKIRKVNLENTVKAIVSVTIGDEFVIHDIKVVETPKGIFVAMPSRKTPDGKYRDIAHPISQEVRAILSQAVLEAFQSAAGEKEQAAV